MLITVFIIPIPVTATSSVYIHELHCTPSLTNLPFSEFPTFSSTLQPMAETAESAETKKIIGSRAEIDTSPPFESVKEAVDRFGGSGPWIPHHLLRLAAAHHNEALDVERIEEQAMQLERDLIMKEQQTLNVLKELESAKRFVESLKLNLMPQFSSFMDSPENLKLQQRVENPTLFNEPNRAKLNLNKTSVDLAAIQACVESLNTKLRKDKILLHRQPSQIEEAAISVQPNQHGVQVLDFEVEQFKKMTEASRYEVMKAMEEIERTKNCIKMAEMRLNAAKKMEEAAKAVEAIAIAQRNPNLQNYEVLHQDGITLSFDEYKALSHKAKQAEEHYKTKFIDKEAPILEKFEETTNRTFDHREGPNHTNVVIEDSFSRNNFSKFKFRNSHRNGDEAHEERANPGFRSTTSIGNLLSRKVIVENDVMVERNVESRTERQHVSLSQMLREQSRLILHPNKNSGEGNVQKQYFMQRKKFGFIQVPIPTKQSKKKSAAS